MLPKQLTAARGGFGGPLGRPLPCWNARPRATWLAQPARSGLGSASRPAYSSLPMQGCCPGNLPPHDAVAKEPKPKTPIRLCVARGRRAEKYHRRPSPGRETQSVGLRCEEGKEASEGDPNPPEPPTWIGSGLGLGQVIPSDCARASTRSRGAMGSTPQDRREGGTRRLGGIA